jgi:hypothetical protein
MPARPRSSARGLPIIASSISRPMGWWPERSEASPEPSLALSIPVQPTDTDDGLLTASEVAELKFDADWVVLSACNTVAGDRPGAEALSGLARVLLCRRPRAFGHALGGRFRSCCATDNFYFRSLKGGSEAWARGGAAPGDARLSRGQVLGPQRLSRDLGSVCPDRSRRGAVVFVVVRRKICRHRGMPPRH